MALRQAEGCTPRLVVGFAIDLNGQQGQIGECSVAEIAVMTVTSNTHLQNIGYFQTPELRNPSAALAEQIEYMGHRFGSLVAVHPGQGDGAVENEAHRIFRAVLGLSVSLKRP